MLYDQLIKMNRREALSTVALLLGGTIIGADAFLSGCSTGTKTQKGILTADNIAFLDEVGETILPATASSPGAKAAKIGEFMNTMVSDCYTPANQKLFTDGIVKLNASSQTKYQKSFVDLEAGQKHDLLVQLDTEAKEYQKNMHAAKPAEPAKDAKTQVYEAAAREANLNRESIAAKVVKPPEHYFTMFKQLTLWGYFTSKEGATKALSYVAVPGHYDGDVPYLKGQKAWATS